MTRRLRTDRMLRRVRETRTVELLRASGEEIRANVESGDWTINRARRELGLPALGPAGDKTAQARPGDLPNALQWHGLITDDEAADWQRYWDHVIAEGRPHRVITLPHRAEWTPTPKRPRKSTPRGVPRMRVRARRNNREYCDALIARTVQLYGQLQTVNQILEAHGLPTRSTDPNGAPTE